MTEHRALMLDAGVLIAHLDSGDAHHEGVEALLEAHASARLLASALTIAECLVRPAIRGLDDRIEGAIDELGVERVPLEAEQARALARVRADSGLRMPDAVVLHAADLVGAAVCTTDRQVARAATARGLAVVTPVGLG